MIIALTTIFILLVAAVLVWYFLMYKKNHQKWTCVEGKCEMDINGIYGSKTECTKACNYK